MFFILEKNPFPQVYVLNGRQTFIILISIICSGNRVLSETLGGLASPFGVVAS